MGVSHQLEQNKIDGDKTILHSLTEAQSKEHDTFAFGLHEVYGVDVLVSTGDGTNKEKDAKTVIFKKTDMTYMLKMKTSREFLSQVTKTYGTMPFNLRNFEEEKKARMGVVEAVKDQEILTLLKQSANPKAAKKKKKAAEKAVIEETGEKKVEKVEDMDAAPTLV